MFQIISFKKKNNNNPDVIWLGEMKEYVGKQEKSDEKSPNKDKIRDLYNKNDYQDEKQSRNEKNEIKRNQVLFN